MVSESMPAGMTLLKIKNAEQKRSVHFFFGVVCL